MSCSAFYYAIIEMFLLILFSLILVFALVFRKIFPINCNALVFHLCGGMFVINIFTLYLLQYFKYEIGHFYKIIESFSFFTREYEICTRVCFCVSVCVWLIVKK